ncbi:MAG: sulfatase-like hydrolase/transferase [Anaerovoracaceae bacterium]|jgi:hypothetical protein
MSKRSRKRQYVKFIIRLRKILLLDKPPIKIGKHVKLTWTRLVIGAVFAVLALALVLSHTGQYLNNDELSTLYGGLMFGVSIALALLIGASMAFTIDLSGKAARPVSTVFYLATPVIMACMTEAMQGVNIWSWSFQTLVLNYILFFVIMSIVAVFAGRFREPIIAVTIISFCLAYAAALVMEFRGTPLMPADLVTISTGLGVANGYHYHYTYYMIFGILVAWEMLILGFRMPKVRIRRKFHNIFRLVSLALVIAIIVPFYTTSIAANAGIKPDFWNQARGYKRTGTCFNFVLNSRYLIVSKPEGYDASEISGYINDVIAGDENDHGILASAQEMQAENAAAEAASDTSDTSSSSDTTTDTTTTDTTTDTTTTDTTTTDTTTTDTTTTDTATTDTTTTDTTTTDNTTTDTTDTTDTGTTAAAALINGQNSTTDTSADGNTSALPNTGIDTGLAVQGTSTTDQPETSAKLEDGEVPNIIVIMNETFADLRVLGQLSTNKDYMPFVRNLTKNTIKGNLYMPVNGAGTSNSEFEFLTGNSMAFLTSGSNAYELYIKNKLPSFVRTLANQGYSRTAYHTYYKESWKRNSVYPLLGFENFYALEDILDTDTVNAYKNNEISFFEYQQEIESQHPGENVLLRRFVSDQYDYKVLEQMYEERNKDYPFFMFNVTMQNHGGYDLSYSNFTQEIQITSTDKFYPKANRYLSLIYESDKAFEELVNYFSQSSEPTMIVMFGDHQPSIEDEFIESLLGKSLDDLTVSENQKRYITPFVIWTNYNSQSGYIDKISVNYLSTLVLQQAGLATTDFNDYLSALYRKMPVIDTTGYITSDNKYYTYDDNTEYTELLNQYSKIEYNYLFDTINKDIEQYCIDSSDMDK